MTVALATVSHRLGSSLAAERALAAVVICGWGGMAALATMPTHPGPLAPATSSLLHALVMTAATMLPLALPGVRFVIDQSLRRRRRQAAIAYAAAFWIAWILVALIAQAVVGIVSSAGGLGWRVVPLSLLIAAAWQVLPARSAIARACGSAIPLPPTGAMALLADIEFGLLSAARCAGTCWPLMLMMAAAPASLALAAGAAAVALVDRYAETTRRHPSVLALGYALVACVLLGAQA